ncbi:MAG: alpha-L-fucosidase [Isosphaeraceae bacterium]
MSLRFGMFLHFNIATFANEEWATGHEDPALFRPNRLDCNQWARAAKAAGMHYGVLTVKHTEGYPLWDSATTTHDVTAFRNFRGGKGDGVREFVDAFRAHGLRVGLYYCFPGDYSKGKLAPGQPDLHGLPPEAKGPGDVAIIKAQLRELLTNYGPIDLLWIDQYANPYTRDRWSEIRAFVASLQPDCLVEGNNSHDFAETDLLSYEFPWKPILPRVGNTDPSEVCDTIQEPSIWFWKPDFPQDRLKPADRIVERLRLCNERHANYLLNVPPDRDGRISDRYVERLREVGARLGVSASQSVGP